MKDLRTYILETKKISSIDNHIQEGFRLGKNKVKKEEENDFVDLGLPSGTLWCKHNVGATCGSDPKSWYGDYFMWGDIEPANNKTCNWDNYKYCNGNYNKLNKYCTIDETDCWRGTGDPDNKLVLDLEDDMANANMNGDWKMPTKEQCQELIDNTTNKYINDYNGISNLKGILFESKINNNTLFIPGTGFHADNTGYDIGYRINIWSSSINKDYPNCAYSIISRGKNITTYYNDRYYGYCVRAVIN